MQTSLFFNTTNESDAFLKECQAKAKKQDEIIMGIYKYNRDKKLSPSDVMGLWEKYTAQPAPPITSIRRSMTTLEQDGQLVKLDEKKIGIYGRPEHFWTVN